MVHLSAPSRRHAVAGLDGKERWPHVDHLDAAHDRHLLQGSMENKPNARPIPFITLLLTPSLDLAGRDLYAASLADGNDEGKQLAWTPAHDQTWSYVRGLCAGSNLGGTGGCLSTARRAADGKFQRRRKLDPDQQPIQSISAEINSAITKRSI